MIAVGHALSSVYGARAPASLSFDGEVDNWPVYASASLARANYALESVIALRNRKFDAAVMVRVLYEHIVTFAWAAIDPGTHVPMLIRTEADERRKATTNVEKFQALTEEAQACGCGYRKSSRNANASEPPESGTTNPREPASGDLYEILQVSSVAEAEVIEGAYKRLAAKYHPDRNHASDARRRMRQLKETYSVLRDHQKRAAYDRARRSSSARANREPSAPDRSEGTRRGTSPTSTRDSAPIQVPTAPKARRRRPAYGEWLAWICIGGLAIGFTGGMAIFVLPLIWLGLRMFSEHACRSEERRLSAICGQLRLAGKDELADGLEKFKPLIREDSETYNDAMAELGFWKG